MPWSLGGVTIHVDEDSDNNEPVLGEIQVLEATDTTLHYAGAKSENRSLRFWVETEANHNALEAAAKADSNVALVGDLGGQGNYRIRKLTMRRQHAVNQANPWWRGSVELTKR
jgi:hypothetical protein